MITKLNLEDIYSSLIEAKTINQLKQYKSELITNNEYLDSLKSRLKEAKNEDKQKIGRELKEVKDSLDNLYKKAWDHLIERMSKSEPYDFSMPFTEKKHLDNNRSISLDNPRLSPVTLIKSRLINIFKELGYFIADSAEIDQQKYNFDYLNIPESHPARDMQDTFYLDLEAEDGSNLLLRTHTSNEQTRFLVRHREEINSGKLSEFKLISIGRVYRNEDEDYSHLATFDQIEALVVGESVSISDLLGTLELAFVRLFNTDVEIRFRNNYFPFTEPSFEMDAKINGKWLEIGGCGMVNKKVFDNCEIDSSNLTGFAFGFGIQRIINIVFGLNDIRLLRRLNLAPSNNKVSSLNIEGVI